MSKKTDAIGILHKRYITTPERKLFLDYEREIASLEAKLAESERKPIHLGFFYNDEKGITDIYVLDKDGNETDREVKAKCLLEKISTYFNRAKLSEERLAESEAKRREAESFILTLFKCPECLSPLDVRGVDTDIEFTNISTQCRECSLKWKFSVKISEI